MTDRKLTEHELAVQAEIDRKYRSPPISYIPTPDPDAKPLHEQMTDVDVPQKEQDVKTTKGPGEPKAETEQAQSTRLHVERRNQDDPPKIFNEGDGPIVNTQPDNDDGRRDAKWQNDVKATDAKVVADRADSGKQAEAEKQDRSRPTPGTPKDRR